MAPPPMQTGNSEPAFEIVPILRGRCIVVRATYEIEQSLGVVPQSFVGRWGQS